MLFLPFSDITNARSAASPENGPRPLKSFSEKPSSSSSRVPQEPHRQSSSTQNSRKSNTSQGHSDQESRHDHWDKGAGSRNKYKPAWRPIREVLNVDTVLNELEQRRQQQQDSSKTVSQERGRSDQRVSTHEHAQTVDERKQKYLMTIYEEEHRQKTDSHSSMESESKVSQQRNSRLKGCSKPLLRSDTWTIQRTESGYESSDRLSSGSTNPDSPGVDGFGIRPDQRSTPEAYLQR